MKNKLPERWKEVELFRYLELASSGVKRFSGIKKYVDTGSLETGKIKDFVDVNYKDRPSRANMEVKDGDVLFAKMKDTEKIYLVSKEDANHLYSTGFAVLRIKDNSKLISKYIYFWLRTENFQKLKNRECTGATQKAIGETKLRKFRIVVPPLGTQKQIVSILEKAEKAKEWRKEADKLTNDFLKSVFMEMFGDPVKNTKRWDIETIENLVKKTKYSIKRGPFGGALKKEIFVNKGYLVYEQFHALNNDFNFGRYFIDDKKFQELKAFEVFPEDIIISCSGIYLGKLAIVPKEAKRGIINQALLKISLDKNKYNNVFFTYVFRSENFRNTFFGDDRGSGIPNFPPMPTFKQFKFITPPIELQNQFFSIVKEVEHMKEQQKHSKENIDNLFNVLMQKAFKGELVV